MEALANLFLSRAGPSSGTGSLRVVSTVGPAPSARESHSCACVGSKMCLFGGFDGSRVLNDLYTYDLADGVWAQLVHVGLSPPARAGHSACALGQPAHMLVFGGANSLRRFADVHVFDSTEGSWARPPLKGHPPAARYYHAAVVCRGSLLVFGGNDGAGVLGDLHSLSTESWAWSQPSVAGAPQAGFKWRLPSPL